MTIRMGRLAVAAFRLAASVAIAASVGSSRVGAKALRGASCSNFSDCNPWVCNGSECVPCGNFGTGGPSCPGSGTLFNCVNGSCKPIH
jgi:hypothetical protein